jgi:hypothetical protein
MILRDFKKTERRLEEERKRFEKGGNSMRRMDWRLYEEGMRRQD